MEKGRLVLVLLLLMVLPAKTRYASAIEISDSIMVGERLTGSQTRISNNGIFQFGFFNLVDTDKWYVGIWYAQVAQQTIVWVANRDYPLQKSSGIFSLTENGALVLAYAGSIIWSTNGTQRAFSAVMSDTGNLVIHNSSATIWESFDYPGSVWLPGMKMTQSRKLTSWKSRWDPSPGIFSLQMDPSGANQVVLLWNTSIDYWQSGSWDERFFNLAPMTTNTQNLKYNFSTFINGRSKYISFSVSPLFTYLANFVMKLDTSGEIRIYFLQKNTKKWSLFWSQPGKQCGVYAACGAYGVCNQNNVQSCNCQHGFRPKNYEGWISQEWWDGCDRQTPLECHSDGFLRLTGSSTPPGAVKYKGKLSLDDCKEACLTNCSCTAYAYFSNCELWFGELLNLYDDAPIGVTLFVRLAASDVPKSSSKNNKAILAESMAGGVGGFAVIVAIVVFFLHRRSVINSTEFSALPPSLKVFSYRELKNATNDFSERLGGGAFGSVFKGTLADRSLVAVKKLEHSSGHGQGEKQFRTEVSTVGIIQHVNLVRLRGFCSEGSNRMLVYEYMPNGSLDRFLFNREEFKVLEWKTRFEITLGTARGIHYLHEKCRDCIIHCDIKPDNIILDSDFCPKLADFGLAKGIAREFSHVLTTTRGTRGYLAPEWISGLPITPKADVYSFGMTLLEIIAGRRNMDADPDWSELFFPSWAATQINRGNAMALLDQRLKEEDEMESVEVVKRAAMVGGWCVQDEEDARPSMGEVVQMLEGTLDVTLPPIPFSLQRRPSPLHTTSST